MNESVFLFVLATVQAIAEWLPISSSGHLVLLQKFFFNEVVDISLPMLTLNVFLHGITLLSALVFFRKKLWYYYSRVNLLLLVLVADLPVVIVGLALRDEISLAGENLGLIAGCFLITGLILMIAKKKSPSVNKSFNKMTKIDALHIGLFQSFALLPGISRSGITISIARLKGFGGEDSAVFSLLIGMPLIFGIFLYEIKAIENVEQSLIFPLFLSSIICFVLGYFALSLLFRYSHADKLHIFAYYLFPLGIITFLIDTLF